MSKQKPLPTLTDVLDARIQRAMAGMNCIAVGTINTFDSTHQTATVSMNYKRVIKEAIDNPDGSKSDMIKDYPILVRCPIFVLSGGVANLTMPIAKGDTCLLLFCDRELDTWYSSGNTDKPPANGRLHDLGDAVALVGIHSLANPIANFNTFHIKIDNVTGKILLIADGGIDLISSNVNASANLSSGTGFSGSFSTGSGQVVTVANGIVINVD